MNSSSGLASGLVATAFTHPFDMIKTRIQLDPAKYRNVFVAFYQVVQKEGFKSLFSGFLPRVGRKSLSSAMMWAFYEEALKRIKVT